MKLILTILLVACLGACSGQIKDEIVMNQRSAFLVNYSGSKAVIDSVVSSELTKTIVTWEGQIIEMESQNGVIQQFVVQDKLGNGVYLTTDGTNVHTVLHFYVDDNGNHIIYLQKAHHIVRLSEKPLGIDVL